jgi:Rrf2 family protein
MQPPSAPAFVDKPRSRADQPYDGPRDAGMKVSTRGDYASRALLSLALHGGGSAPTSVRDIAQRTGLPQPYLEQILLVLKGAGLVRSKRGVGGGYVLADSPENITLSQIVSAVDGPIVAGDFGRPHEGGACEHEGQCALLAVWWDMSSHMRTFLDSFSLADLVERAQGLVAPADVDTPTRISPPPTT